MIIYLKSGQSIDMGDVKFAMDVNGEVYKPSKYCEEDDILLCLFNLEDSENTELTIDSNNGKRLLVQKHDIIGIMEDAE